MKKRFVTKKSLGQNFLRSTAIVKKIISAAHISPGETVLEIGPGKGILTKELLLSGAKVYAIEKDHRLIEDLEKVFSPEIQNGSFTLIHGDVLECYEKVTSLFNGYKIVANIPYYISGALLRLSLESSAKPKTMVLMVQKEVAKRIVARDEKESILSLSVKAYGKPRYVDTVKKEYFKPVPKVDSAIIAIEHISQNFFSDIKETLFFLLIKTSFNQKRKTLGATLKLLFKNHTQEIFADSGINPKSRPEDLSLEEWKILVQSMQKFEI